LFVAIIAKGFNAALDNDRFAFASSTQAKPANDKGLVKNW